MPAEVAPELTRQLDRGHDVRIEYRVLRAPGAPLAGTIVLLHGLASNLSRWSEFVESTRLTRRWNLIRIDLRGHGGSMTRRPVSLEVWSDDLAAILDAESSASAVLVGHSLGAQVALHMAATRPERARALALIDPVFGEALRARWAAIARMRRLLAALAVTVRALNAIGLHRRRLAPLDLRVLDAEARRALEAPAGQAEFTRRYASMTADLRHVPSAVYFRDLAELFRPAPAPASIACPVLALLSRSGTFADPAITARIARGFPHGELVEIDCQHWPLTERPIEVRTAIERWCDRLQGPS